MKQRKPPQEKKAESYTKDSLYRAWRSDKADRKKRPKAKALDHRVQRHREQNALHAAVTGGEDTVADGPAPVRKPEIRYNSISYPLVEALEGRRSRDVNAIAFNYFKDPYSSEDHREPFARFLADVVAGGTGDSQALASLFRETLELPESINCAAGRQHQRSLRSGWMHKFFADEPDWETRLREWIESSL